MSGSTKALVLDLNSKPAPQFYEPVSDAYVYLQGDSDGAAWQTTIPPNGSFTATSYTVGIAAARVEAGVARRRLLRIFNRGTADIFVGPANTVTTANGYPIPVGTGETFLLGPGLAVYAISAVAGQDVRVLEVAG